MASILQALYSVVVSIVSHRQGRLVSELLSELVRYCAPSNLAIVLALNTPEPLPYRERDFGIPVHIRALDIPDPLSATSGV